MAARKLLVRTPPRRLDFSAGQIANIAAGPKAFLAQPKTAWQRGTIAARNGGQRGGIGTARHGNGTATARQRGGTAQHRGATKGNGTATGGNGATSRAQVLAGAQELEILPTPPGRPKLR